MELLAANMYFIPTGILLLNDASYAGATMMVQSNITVGGFMGNLIPVTLGNIVGGGLFVALSYYLIYLRGKK